MQYLKHINLSILLLTFLNFSCNDENGTIVIPGGGSGGTNNESPLNNCNFEGVSSQYSSCLNNLSEEELNIVTWNIENFPNSGTTTINAVKNIIENMNADVIAVQEITSISDFIAIGDATDGWEARALDVSGRLDFGYLYKTCEISAFETPYAVLDGPVEPRPAARTTISHIGTGLTITLFNIHLKCCGETGSNEADRREASSIALQNHINANLADENVIVLGDWNDDIDDGPFDNFINDPGFSFADQNIANGPSSNYSYISSTFISHLDHILISNELFDNKVSAETIKLSSCLPNYETTVSDHRPVMLTLKKN